MTAAEASGPGTPAPPTVSVRPGATEDLPALAELHLAARASAAMPPVGDPREVRERVRGWDLDDHDVWVAEAPGLPGGPVAPVGYVRLDGAWLDDLYVAPAHQGRGVGTLLLEVVCSLRPHGFGLWVYVENTRAREFYAARGLVELEHTDGSGNREHVPDACLVWPGDRPLRYLREAIDDVDEELALLLARRFALAGAVQDLKAATEGRGGHEARDPGREAQIVARMAALAPSVRSDRLERVMGVVLDEGLAAWHARTVDAV